ncbi:enoyl-CoA hydratase-related protein [Fodinicola feengrottensis]|uniref:Crotonase/enoyl-CoA hydratase family protein n=1 Tax=Fodinicola feengrottensis TaxID=435914 RepID=A0ABN2HLX0_9ACTN|nr:enoyl-CoA hydratase-related protein [Fodinicola feengrottensis]
MTRSSGNYQTVVLDRVGTDARVGRITLDRPERLNALSGEMLDELWASLHEFEADESVRVIILRGNGRAFCAGYDLSDPHLTKTPGYPDVPLRTSTDDDQPLAMNFASNLKRGAELQLHFWNMPKVTLAEVHGYCIAGGMEFAMMADLVVAASDAVIGHPGSRGVGVARNAAMLPVVTNMRKAKELLYTGGAVTGTQAEQLGMINYAVDLETLSERAIALADRVANLSADHLAVLKAAANRFYENAGIYSSIRSVTELDAIAQNTESAHTWRRVVQEQGFRAAVEWRDKPYGDYGFAERG